MKWKSDAYLLWLFESGLPKLKHMFIFATFLYIILAYKAWLRLEPSISVSPCSNAILKKIAVLNFENIQRVWWSNRPWRLQVLWWLQQKQHIALNWGKGFAQNVCSLLKMSENFLFLQTRPTSSRTLKT